MRKNSQYISISEYCKANGLHTTKFYETLSRHPEVAKKLKTNVKGERLLDEKSITAAGAILRKELAQKADLIGAVRLPNNAFKANAGTEVTSDIIFLQKRSAPLEELPDWVHLGKIEDGLKVNSYFAENPEMVLGTIVEGNKLYGRNDNTMCIPIDGADFRPQIHEAVQKLNTQISQVKTNAVFQFSDKQVTMTAAELRLFSFFKNDKGDIYLKGKVMDTKSKDYDRMTAFIDLRDTVRELLKVQADDRPENDIKTVQQKLSVQYDDFYKKYGLLHSRKNRSVLRDDCSYNLLLTLEKDFNKDKLIAKSDIFTQRTVRPSKPIEHVDTALQAAIPEPLKASDIDVKIGATWIPKELYQQFMNETFQTPRENREDVKKAFWIKPKNITNVSYDDVEIRYVKRSNTSTFGHQTNFFHRESNILPHSQTTNSEINRYENIDSTLYYEILKAKFPRGFRLNDKLDIKKFRKYWKELCNEENPLSNECIWDYISHITIAHGKMSYLPEMMIEEETKTELINYIEETFSNGKTAIYYEALYQTFRDELDKGRINNAEMLKTYLEYTTKNKYFLQKTYITIDSKAKVDATDEVRRFLKSYEMPMTTENIIKGLPHLDKDKITFALSGNNSYEFVRNQKGEYFHADIIEFTDSEIARIEQWISDSITQNEYMSSKELTSLIDRYLPEIHERYTFLTELGLRDTIAYKLRGKFSFKSKIISKYGEDLNMDKVFTRFGKNHTPFSMEQLNALKDELGTTIYFHSLYRCAMRVSKNEFVSRDYANFDISATDNVLEQLCSGDFISLKDVTLFGGFPSCGYTWNSYLLEYYIMYFSEKFKLLHTSFNMNSSVGAIVKKNAGIETFDDVLVKALAESSIALITDDALNYLCESGLLARRSYSTIDNIVSRAKAYRVKKENKF